MSDFHPTRAGNRSVAIWLFAVAGMIFVMIVLGGLTRLTGSGLSIMEWAPIMGVVPPWSETEWHRLFGLYRQIPQYELVNQDFGLDGFKRIFWLEWTHRLWGRLIGAAFLIPLMWFWAKGQIAAPLKRRLAVLFLLGGAQGGVGWFMVASGFVPNSTSVSPYRLVVHLGLALLLYAAILWAGFSVIRPSPVPRPKRLQALVWLTMILVSLTILAGGFVAGLHAGLTFNTFPLMDGALIPAGYADQHPFWRNLTENVAAVQFNHRLLATLASLSVVITLVLGWPHPILRPRLAVLGAAVLAQYGLGVAILLDAVPVGLAALHQAGAVLLLTAALWLLHAIRRT